MAEMKEKKTFCNVFLTTRGIIENSPKRITPLLPSTFSLSMSSISLKFSFPIFSPPTTHRPSTTELRFSRWHNASAEPFLRHQRAQEEIERDLRLHRRFQSLSNLTQNPNPCSDSQPPPSTVDFKSNGTPSSPSAPSILGKRSKYSKPNPNSKSHPAFRRPHKARFSPNPNLADGIAITDRGIAYKMKDAPFEFQYSYTETPKVKPLALREQPYLPFGSETMPRPWTGRRPLPESKKKLPEFDSFKLPPAGKKGVKPVQSPGPFLMGSGPKFTAMTREEVLGEELTAQEVKELVKGCLKTRRQLNMGRDGLTHNMLDNIHAHWKRKRVCKIKCKGVCTVDMDNVRQQLEEKSGGKIIYGRGGVLFLFRGRNYNYRTRPRFPLMLWKPVTPVYPRLVQRVPEGLTLEEASEMRKRGRQLPPICKLGKNGVYSNLVKNVKEAFEACELVRIDCKDLNKSDCRKIGAKLKDLVPCVLISFEYEHILMWRGKDWKSSLPSPEDDNNEAVRLISGDSTTISTSVLNLEVQESVESLSEKISNEELTVICRENMTQTEDLRAEDYLHLSNNGKSSYDELTPEMSLHSLAVNGSLVAEKTKDSHGIKNVAENMIPTARPQRECLDGIMLLLRQAIESGSAVILDDEELLDANFVYERSVALAKSALPGPVFQHGIRKVFVQKSEKEKTENYEEHDVEGEVIAIPEKRSSNEKNLRRRKRDLKEVFSDVVPHGSLGVDELAKLLA